MQIFLCLFNLSADPQEFALNQPATVIGPSLATTLVGNRALLGPNAAAFLRLDPAKDAR